jgi:hypothetical protein
VVVGPEALKALEARGVMDGDLVADPQLAQVVTRKDTRIAIVRLERRRMGRDVVVESGVWAGGRHDVHIAIAPTGSVTGVALADPSLQAAQGVAGILAPWLASHKQGAATDADGILIALAGARDWEGILRRTADLPAATPRQLYYRIVALVRSRKVAEAEIVLPQLREIDAKGTYTAAAEDLVHVRDVGAGVIDINNGSVTAPLDDGSNILK